MLAQSLSRNSMFFIYSVESSEQMAPSGFAVSVHLIPGGKPPRRSKSVSCCLRTH